jgi:hypothetical protein
VLNLTIIVHSLRLGVLSEASACDTSPKSTRLERRPFKDWGGLEMKRAMWSLLFLMAAALVTSVTSAFAQDATPITQPLQGYYTYGKLQGVATEEALRGAIAATTIPMGLYGITSSRDSNQYTGVLAGRSPFFHGSRTTNIPTFIVPVKVKMPDGGLFDPSVADSTCLGGKVPITVTGNSPLFQSVAFTMNGIGVGTTQYADAFERAEFWKNVSVTGSRFHTMLSPITTLAEQTFTVPKNEGGTFTAGGCENIGIMDFSTWDNFVQTTLIPFVTAHGGGATSFPLFVLYNVVMADPFDPGTSENCCILGYHNSFASPIQTYGVADFDSVGAFSGTADISGMSHEVNEWLNDPTGDNPTPSWGHIGQVSGCQNNFEVGDPLSGTLFPTVTLNSFNYHLQELAFFSWFFGGPSIGTSTTQFSNNGTFTSDAGAICE